MKARVGILAALLLAPLVSGVAEDQHAVKKAAGKPLLHPLFSDHMVLQRDTETSIWGWTVPGKEVTVSLAGKTTTAVAAADGKWLAKLGPLPAGGPHKLTATGPQTVTVEDVLVGDVWLCSGQSNMQMRVNAARNAKEEVAAADYPRIRFFAVPWCGFRPGEPQVVYTEPQEVVAAEWKVCSPQTAGGFSAVGYFFGRDLQKEVGVPIGLISAAVGGSAITSWCSPSVLQTDPDSKVQGLLRPVDTLRALVRENKVGEEYFKGQVKDWWRDNDIGTREDWSQPKLDTGAWTKIDLSATGSKPELPRYDGIVWCRLEANVPPEWAGKDLRLFITGIWEADTQWFNGTQVGAFGQGWINRTSTIPGKLVQAGRNVVAVRVQVTPGHNFQGPATNSTITLAESKPPVALPLGSERLLCESAPKSKLTPFPHRYDNDFQIATVLYNGEIAPLLPYALKGMLWYQGETPCPAGNHRRILTNMIADWRTRFQSPDAWFLIVQLPVLGGLPSTRPDDVGCAAVRADQWAVGHTVTNADTAVTVDLGDPNDIHPLNKQDVGKRLALIARARIYGQPVEYSGPVVREAKREGNAVRVTYDHLGGGLILRGDKLEGFAVASAEQNWVWADAKVDGDTVVVSSSRITNPKFLRYDFVNVPRYCLYNRTGLPAAPFHLEIKP